MRPLFTDGFNSAVHAGLGFAFGAKMLIPFLVYQWILKPDVNSATDSAEYVAGWLLRGQNKSAAG